jgi:hypothetical protein
MARFFDPIRQVPLFFVAFSGHVKILLVFGQVPFCHVKIFNVIAVVVIFHGWFVTECDIWQLKTPSRTRQTARLGL